MPLTDPCGWTEQDLPHERSACCCWCSRQGDLCPRVQLRLPNCDTTPVCVLTLLRCFHGEYVSKQHRRTAFDGWSSNALDACFHRDISWKCWNESMCLFVKTTCEKVKRWARGSWKGVMWVSLETSTLYRYLNQAIYVQYLQRGRTKEDPRCTRLKSSYLELICQVLTTSTLTVTVSEPLGICVLILELHSAFP